MCATGGIGDYDRALGLLQGYLDGRSQISVPALLGYEFGDVLRYKADLTTAQVETAIRALFDLEVEWITPSPTVIRRAVVIAREPDTTVYDAICAGLSERIGATFVPADERPARQLSSLHHVIFLGVVTAPAQTAPVHPSEAAFGRHAASCATTATAAR